jgi:ABC-type lipoprotein release transport system permease subunit
MVIKEAFGTTLRPSLLGMVCGLLVAVAGMRLASSLLFGVEGLEGSVGVGAFLSMAAVALVATYLPARKGAELNPAEILKGE